jgi:signal transduction histidine kinase
VLSVTTPRGVALTRRELRLLDDLSHHAGLLVANAKLTVDLAHELHVVQTRAADLRRAREELVRTQDRRRRALERDIHDGAQQQLVALLIMLRSLGRRAAKARTSAGVPGGRVDGSLEGALDGARSVLAATDDTLARLSGGAAPAVLVREGLEAALRDAAGTIGELGPAVRVQVDSPSLGSGELQTALYFCCLEALQNAVKHAAASRIDVLVRPAAGRVEFLVTDDGRGFDQQLAAGGSGLGNLGSRLVPFGGGVEVQSAPGRGTTVHGWAPLRDEPRPEEARDRPVGAPT